MRTRIAALTGALALLSAGSAAAAAPKVATVSGAEGSTISVPISHKCKAAKCRYDVTTLNGTATAGSDYTPNEITGKVRKNKRFAVTLDVATIPDAACEPDETFSVHVVVVTKGGVSSSDTTETITDDGDCPKPSVSHVIPADAQITNTRDANSAGQTCQTPFAQGRPSGSDGYLTPACYAAVVCPQTATAGCTADATWTLEAGGPHPNGHVVELGFAKLYAPDGTGVVGGHSGDCDGYGSCTAQLAAGAVRVAAGQTLEVSCAGRYSPDQVPAGATPQGDTTARVGCSVRLSWG